MSGFPTVLSWKAGPAANRPTIGQTSVGYWAVDTAVLSAWNGAAWVTIGGSGSGIVGPLTGDITTIGAAGTATTLQNTANVQAVIAANLNNFDTKNAVALATAAPLPTNTYANGAAGIGATLTATANGALTVDGQAVTAGQRILVKNEATPANNGIYTVTATGVTATLPYILTRSLDFDTSAEIAGGGDLVPVSAGGTANGSTVWISLAAAVFVVGTTNVTFSQVGAGSGGLTAIPFISANASAFGPYALTTSFAAIDATHLTASIPAATGDQLLITCTATSTSGTNSNFFLDIAIAGTRIGTAGDGIAVALDSTASGFGCVGFSVGYTVQAGDISGGTVLVVPYAKKGSGTINLGGTGPYLTVANLKH